MMAKQIQPLIDHIKSRGVALHDTEIESIQHLFRHKKFRKNQYVLQTGEIARYETFVIRGLLRTYLVDDKGQEHVIQFSAEDWWAGDLFSFFSDKPTSYNIDCLETSEVLQITKNDLEKLQLTIPTINHYLQLLYRNATIALNQRIASSLCNTATERYLDFLERYPAIQQRVPDHQIASYLGITPPSLSRIRRQFFKSK